MIVWVVAILGWAMTGCLGGSRMRLAYRGDAGWLASASRVDASVGRVRARVVDSIGVVTEGYRNRCFGREAGNDHDHGSCVGRISSTVAAIATLHYQWAGREWGSSDRFR